MKRRLAFCWRRKDNVRQRMPALIIASMKRKDAETQTPKGHIWIYPICLMEPRNSTYR
jgi:hypothetical protein